MKYQVTVPPATEPIALAEARTHLRVDVYGSPEEHPDDAYIEALITAARQWCEEYTSRALATQTVVVALDGFKGNIELPLAPVQSITSIQYLDADGVTQTLATSVYVLDPYTSAIHLKYNQVWPDTRAQVNAVTVTYQAGYTVGESPDEFQLPKSIISAMYLLIGHLYENRQQVTQSNTKHTFNSLPMGIETLLQPYRLGLGV